MRDVEDRLNQALSDRFDPVEAPPLPAEVITRANRRHLVSLAGAIVITGVVAAGFVAALVSLAPLGRHEVSPVGQAIAVGTTDPHGRTVLAAGHASFGDWNVSMGQGEFCFSAEDSSCAPAQHLEAGGLTTTSFNLTQSSGEPIMGQVGSAATSVRIEAFDGKTFDATILDPPADTPQASRVFVAVLDGYGDGGDYAVTAYDAEGKQVGATSAGGNPMANKYLGMSPAPTSDSADRMMLHKALAAAQDFHAANGTYVGFTPEQAAAIEPSLSWSTRVESAAGIVVIRQVTQDSVLLTTSDYAWSGCVASSPAGTVEASIAAETVQGCSQTRGKDLLAQSHLRRALAAAETYFKDKGSFAGLDAGVLGSLNGVDDLGFTDSPTNDGMIVVRDVSDNTLLLVDSLQEGSYFCLGEVATGPNAGIRYGTTDAVTVAGCNDGPASWDR
jgi:hypothetical protein